MRRRGVRIGGRRWILWRLRWLVAGCTGLARIAMRRWRGMRLRFGGGRNGKSGRFCVGLEGGTCRFGWIGGGGGGGAGGAPDLYRASGRTHFLILNPHTEPSTSNSA